MQTIKLSPNARRLANEYLTDFNKIRDDIFEEMADGFLGLKADYYTCKIWEITPDEYQAVMTAAVNERLNKRNFTATRASEVIPDGQDGEGENNP